MTKAAHTPGPYHWRLYASEPEDVKRARKLGIDAVRMLTNEGQIALMAGSGEDVKRIALIDCQTTFKRGHGHKTECAERDATANLFAAAPEMLAALQEARLQIEYLDAKFQPTGTSAAVLARINAVIAKAETAS